MNRIAAWPEIPELGHITGISNAQRINIERATTIGGSTETLRRMLRNCTEPTGRVRAVVRTVIDKGAGPYLAENPGPANRHGQQCRPDAITILISGRRNGTGAVEHVALDTDAIVDTPDEHLYEASALQAVVTSGSPASEDEITALLSDVYASTMTDEEIEEAGEADDDDWNSETRHAATTALNASDDPPPNEETVVMDQPCLLDDGPKGGNRVWQSKVQATTVLRVGETKIQTCAYETTKPNETARLEVARRSRQQAVERLHKRRLQRLGKGTAAAADAS